MDTLTRIRDELQPRKGDWPLICTTTGLSYWWLTKFAQGRIREPGLSKIERLQDYFDTHPLPPPPACRTSAAKGDAAEATPVVLTAATGAAPVPNEAA